MLKLIVKTFTTLFLLTRVLSKKISTTTPTILQPKKYVLNLTPKQEELIHHLDDPLTKACFVLGPAGTGKTLLSCQYAIQELLNKRIHKIVVTKPFITVSDEAIGFLPGGIQSKLDPWMQNIMHCLSHKDMKRYIDSKQIEFTPMGFMRGTTLENTILIADEMQNSSPSQMKMLLTRVGNNTKMIMTGDMNQKDISSVSGLEDFLGLYKRDSESIKIVEFTTDDIKREGFVKEVLEIYEGKKTTVVPKNTLAIYKELLSDKNGGGGFNDLAMIPKVW